MEKVAGLNNTGVLCWFNSLLQGLFSCKYFVSIIENIDGEANPLVSDLQKIIKVMEAGNTKACDSCYALRSLLQQLKEKEGDRYNSLSSAQQSASEGFTLLLDYIDSKPLNIAFMHKYEERIVCIQTGEIESKKDGFNNQFMVFDETELQKSGLADYIKYHEHDLHDYKSEKRNTNPAHKYKRVYALKYLPKVVVLLLNRYYTDGHGRHRPRNPNISLPAEFEMPSVLFNGAMVYKKVAEVDHLGGLGGGHYISKVMRGGEAYLCNDSITTDYRLGTSPNTYITFCEYSHDRHN